MVKSDNPILSVVVPLHNEAASLVDFNQVLVHALDTSTGNLYEIIYVDDGSSDNTAEIIQGMHAHNQKISLLKLSRNFGKENALSAGIAAATGQAILMLDGDGQHPVELISAFLNKWKDGAQLVVGIRTSNSTAGWTKRVGSKLYYKIFNLLTGQKRLASSTDFRLIDRAVQKEFLQLDESDRMTRLLIDWLGFRRELIYFEAKPRQAGVAAYNRKKLTSLATHSLVSMSPKPLYLFGYLGIFITLGALLLGTIVIIEQLLLNDPLNWRFTGTAMLGILILFLVGLILISQGILSLYISHIHSQSKTKSVCQAWQYP